MSTIKTFNQLLANMTNENYNRLGVETYEELQNTLNSILSMPSSKEEFLGVIYNKLASQKILVKQYKNRYSGLKGSKVPFGKYIEQIHVNPVKSGDPIPDGSGLLTRHLPKVKVEYLEQNFHQTYSTTFTDDDLRQAFTGDTELSNFITAITSAVYSGQQVDEEQLTKELLGSNIKNGNIQKVYGGSTSKDFIKTIKNVSNAFTHMSSQFNMYSKLNPTDTDKVQTFVDKDEQLLIIREDIETDIDVDVLASAFNMSVTELMKNRIGIDTFGEGNEDIVAVLMDKSTLQIKDFKLKTTSFYNAQGDYTNLYYHVKQMFKISSLTNIVAITSEESTTQTMAMRSTTKK